MQEIWNFLIKYIGNPYGVAGLMGNLNCESGLKANNLEDTGNRRLGLSDDQYVAQVDNGTYTNFVYDGLGFGICQWSYFQRKKNLLEYCKGKGKSISDLTTQLEFLMTELNGSYSSVLKTLKNATSVLEASNAVLFKFECPADQGSSMQAKRASYGQQYYDKYAKGENNMSNNTYKKGQRTQLSESFNSVEFDCHGQGCCFETIINPKLVEYLQQIRDHFNAPITITSGYRCPTHNRNVGGATGSRHSKGDAADIVVAGHSSKEVAQYAESIGIKGIGLYESSSDGYFTHVDTRDAKSFWYGQAQAYRSTFGGSSSSTSDGGTSSKTYYGLNDSGSAVKEIQELLNEKGYSLDTDGIFGSRTFEAVKDFQKKNNLTVDGYVGEQTLKALKGDNQKTKVKVIASLLNVRAGAGIQYPIVDRVSKGAQFELLEKKDGWGRIEKGWVSLEYVE